MGFYISFSGIVTFKNARELQAAAVTVPLDRLLIETDAPYLAPVPHRGRQNEPSYVPHVAHKLAHLHGVESDLVARATTNNFYKLFKALRKKSEVIS
jgi:TatD DNase family protein